MPDDKILWGRQRYGGQYHPWHIMPDDLSQSRCGAMRPNPKRLITQRFSPVPTQFDGRICKKCWEMVIPEEESVLRPSGPDQQ